MEQITVYREAGLSLRAIGDLLVGKKVPAAAVLEGRLLQINKEIQTLRNQQQVLVNLLRNRKALRKTRVMTKEKWVALLAAAGMDETDMRRWHVEFESMAPEAHQDFLESLGIPTKEILGIRKWARKSGGRSRRR
jgi:hypothetical protein